MRVRLIRRHSRVIPSVTSIASVESITDEEDDDGLIDEFGNLSLSQDHSAGEMKHHTEDDDAIHEFSEQDNSHDDAVTTIVGPVVRTTSNIRPPLSNLFASPFNIRNSCQASCLLTTNKQTISSAILFSKYQACIIINTIV